MTDPTAPQGFPVDAVITWVDGTDPALLAKRTRFLRAGEERVHEKACDTTRFADEGELRWCIASILAYAPYIRRIWVVTDGQRPALIDDMIGAGLITADRLRVVDHTDMFGTHAHHLPTFCSLTIETMLWNIDGLAEHFVSFNDDFFLNRPCPADTFFDARGLPVIWGGREPHKLRHRLIHARARLMQLLGTGRQPSPGYGLSQSLGARLGGETGTYVRSHHTPRPLRRSTLRDFYAAHPDTLTQQLRCRFRHHTQHFPVTLANTLELRAHGASYAGVPDMVYVHADGLAADDPVLDRLAGDTAPFGCIQSLDCATDATAARIESIMARKLADFLPPREPD
ncbi:stealth family protein [Sulfitobacter sp. S190]|uniref:stealth family protein n=1 Tax=Sulfitobacter sp. S190 TaxID=2867022 RepID=UPI0021A63033|nr:stealth family protein [Sulfitobacter sp. S190]UWR24131.1 Stealth CR1 domain-containing protein [Sulfitobacter sp. S190]